MDRRARNMIAEIQYSAIFHFSNCNLKFIINFFHDKVEIVTS